MTINQNQNQGEITENVNRLIKQVEIESSYWKKITIGTIGFLSAFFFSYFLLNFIASSSGGSFWLMFISFWLLSMIFLLQLVFVREFGLVVIMIGFETLGLWSFFVWRNWFLGIIGILITFLFLWLAGYYGQLEKEDRIKFRFFRVGRVVMSKFMTGMSIFIAFAYMAVSLTGSTSIVSKDFFAGLLEGSTSWVSKIYPGFSFESSLKDNIEIVMKKRINNDFTLSSLSEEEQNVIINKSVFDYQASVSEMLGTQVDVKNKLSDSLFVIMKDKIKVFFDSYGVFAYIIVISIVALVLRSFAPFISWPVILISYLVYEFLLASGFAYLIYENRSKEVIVVK